MHYYVILCVDHGLMERSQTRMQWYCLNCKRTITDELLFRVIGKVIRDNPPNIVKQLVIEVS